MIAGDLVRHNYGMHLNKTFEWGLVLKTKYAGLNDEILMCRVYWFDAGSPGFYRASDLEIISKL